MLIKNKLKIIVAKAMILIHGANFADDGVAGACRYAAYKIQVANETVSVGYQRQKRLKAATVQVAPSNIPRPKTGEVSKDAQGESFIRNVAEGHKAAQMRT